MTVTGPGTPLCLFQSKVEEALSLVSSMDAEEKLKAVQYWNVVSGKLQEIVNNSAADINALAMKLDENNKKMTLQVDSNNIVAQNGVYANDYMNEVSSYVVCAEPSSQYLTENVDTQNGQYIPSNGTTYTAICFSDAAPIPGSTVCHSSSPSRHVNGEFSTCAKSSPVLNNKCLPPSSVAPPDNNLVDYTLPANEAINSGVSSSSSSNSPKSSIPVQKPRDRRTSTKQKPGNKSTKVIRKKRNVSRLLQLLTDEANENLKESSALKIVGAEEANIQPASIQVQENSTLETSLGSTCSSLSDTYSGGSKHDAANNDHKNSGAEKSFTYLEEGSAATENVRFVCDWCDQEFTDSFALDTHRWTHTKPFMCTECDAQFSSKGNLMVHFRRHTGEKPYNCSTCLACFSTRGNLRRHMKVHSGIKPHECLQCGSRFTEKKSLKVHMRRHTGEKPYGCKMCGKSFSQSGILQAHMAVHLNERAHLCEHCGKAFRQKSQLRVHKLRHQGVKNYICSSCPARFMTKGDLERHTRIHTGERPFVCQICKKTFTRQQSLKEHMNRHYGLKPFRCKHCGKSFAEMSACYKHAKQHEKTAKDSSEQKTGSQENYPQEDNATSSIRISATASLSQADSNSKQVMPERKFTVIFQDPGHDIEVHSEFTVERGDNHHSSVVSRNAEANDGTRN